MDWYIYGDAVSLGKSAVCILAEQEKDMDSDIDALSRQVDDLSARVGALEDRFAWEHEYKMRKRAVIRFLALIVGVVLVLYVAIN